MIIHVIDFAWNGTQTLFVDLRGELNGKALNGMVRIVDGIIYGDLVHPARSIFSESEINYVKNYLEKKIQAGHFDA